MKKSAQSFEVKRLGALIKTISRSKQNDLSFFLLSVFY